MKFPEYANQDISRASDDFLFLRYADILLSRAEALKEINGPKQVSVDLLNSVRDAVSVNTFAIADFATKEAFRDFILDERGREFYIEALRRQDLIRHGIFIVSANERGKSSEDFRVRFSIPQTQIERNPGLTRNDG